LKMDVKKHKADEYRGMDQGRRVESVVGLRKRLLDIRMDIYTPSAQHAGEKHKLKKNLARALTVLNEQKKQAKSK
jgi:ribosomal protein L29